MIQRFFFNIMCTDVAVAKDFYSNLLDFQAVFESDWFVVLKPHEDSPFEFGLVQKDHKIIPDAFRQAPAGAYPCIVTDNVDEIHQRALAKNVVVIEPPTDMFYGQRRMLICDCEGMMVDISSPSSARMG